MSTTSDDQAREWDDRYREHTTMWSGEANGALIAEVGALPAGRALDVCCGEGADAIWLAARGWEVTGVEISQVALDRAVAAATAARTKVAWCRADFASHPPPGEFDLVVSMYPALPHTPGDPAIVAMLGAVAPGGTLLVVHHDMSTHGDHAREAGFDPDDYVQPADVRAHLGRGWRIEVFETRARVQPPDNDGPDVPDIVLRARRDT